MRYQIGMTICENDPFSILRTAFTIYSWKFVHSRFGNTNSETHKWNRWGNAFSAILLLSEISRESVADLAVQYFQDPSLFEDFRKMISENALVSVESLLTRHLDSLPYELGYLALQMIEYPSLGSVSERRLFLREIEVRLAQKNESYIMDSEVDRFFHKAMARLLSRQESLPKDVLAYGGDGCFFIFRRQLRDRLDLIPIYSFEDCAGARDIGGLAPGSSEFIIPAWLNRAIDWTEERSIYTDPTAFG